MLSVQMQLILAFFVIFIGTIYYINSKSFEERNFGLILTSYSQGLIVSFLSPKYLLIAPIVALTYYLIFYNIWSVKFVLKSSKFEPYNEEGLFEPFKKNPEISQLKFTFRKYSGKNSLNANVIPPIPLFSKQYKISFGEELISKFTLEEKIIVLAHEIGHALKKHLMIRGGMQSVLIFVLGIISYMINLSVLLYFNDYFVYLYYTITLILLLVGITGINLISWYIEYDADKIAIQLTQDINNFESAYLKLDDKSHHTKDYGRILNLLVYSHPLLVNRIKRAKDIYTTL